MANLAGAFASNVANAKKDIRASRPNDSRTSILRNHQTLERFNLGAAPRHSRADVERQPIRPDMLVDGDRPQRRKQRSTAASWLLIRISVKLRAEKHIGFVEPQ